MMRRALALALLLAALAIAGSALAFMSPARGGSCGKPHKPPCPTTAPTATTTAPSTTTAPTPPPTTTASPPPGECTKTAVPGADLSTFFATLASGDVACLHGGIYTDGAAVTLATSNVTLTEYPGEQAEIVGTGLRLSGSGTTVSEITIRDVLGTDVDGIRVDGSGNRIEHVLIERVARHGIILGSASSFVTVTRNFVDAAGVDGGAHSTFAPSQIHGIYVQGSGHEVTRNVFVRMTGYGIHLYSSPSNVLVSGNTAIASSTRTGILVRSSGSGIIVANNIFEGGTLHTCGGCTIDTNQVAGGWTIQDPGAPSAANTIPGPLAFADAEYRLAADSAAIDAATPVVVWPDRDGATAANGAPDLGAYER